MYNSAKYSVIDTVCSLKHNKLLGRVHECKLYKYKISKECTFFGVIFWIYKNNFLKEKSIKLHGKKEVLQNV